MAAVYIIGISWGDVVMPVAIQSPPTHDEIGEVTNMDHSQVIFCNPDDLLFTHHIPYYSRCRSVFKKDCYCIPPNLALLLGFGWYAIAVFLKNASTSRVEVLP